MNPEIEKFLNHEISQWFTKTAPEGDWVTPGTEGITLATSRNRRSENQDRAILVEFSSPRAERSFSLIAVFDGIGGMLDGGKCADICIISLISNLIALPRHPNRITLIEALTLANQEVWANYKGRGGTTFAGIFIERNKARSINIGDSRIYKNDHRGLARQSFDDRIGDQFAKLGGKDAIALNPEIARRLGQYIGMANQPKPNVFLVDNADINSEECQFLLATDGAYDTGDSFISEILKTEISQTKAAKTLINKASERDAADNATLILATGKSLQNHQKSPQTGYERLRILTPSGTFNFILPFVEGDFGNSFKSGPPKYQRKSRRKPQKPPLSAAKDGDKNNDSGAANPPSPEVTFEQLTFDSPPINEST